GFKPAFSRRRIPRSPRADPGEKLDPRASEVYARQSAARSRPAARVEFPGLERVPVYRLQFRNAEVYAVMLLENTISEVLADSVRRSPSGLAIVSRHQGARLMWTDVDRATARLAGGLWLMGIRPDDRVGIWSTTCAEWILLQLATARIGAVLVNVN